MKSESLPNHLSASSTKTAPVGRSAFAGFTLIGLMVVIVTLAMLAALLLPALARSKQRAQGDQCLSNLQQLSHAWLMYNGDNRSYFAPNGSEGTQPLTYNPAQQGQLAQWCPGRQDEANVTELSPFPYAANAPNVGYAWIQAGLIYPYVKTVNVYKCPADLAVPAQNTSFGVQYPHVRSRSMNAWLSPLASWGGGPDDSAVRVFLKESDLTVPGPVNTWLLMDENPLSINDAYLVEDPSTIPPPPGDWVDWPASYHNNGGGICFTDGHTQIKNWRDKYVLAANKPGGISGNGAQPADPTVNDCAWLVNRSSALRTTASFQGPP